MKTTICDCCGREIVEGQEPSRFEIIVIRSDSLCPPPNYLGERYAEKRYDFCGDCVKALEAVLDNMKVLKKKKARKKK